MASVLSQEEVDALLQAVEKGELSIESEDNPEIQEYSVVEYNFRRPNLLTKDHFRLFNTLHGYFSREVQASLSLLLRTNAAVIPVATDQQQYNEFILSLAEVTNILKLTSDSPPGSILLEMNPTLVLSIIDVLLGGDGHVAVEDRALTDMEVAIIEPVWERIVGELQSAVQMLIPATIQIDGYESNPEYVQASSGDSPVIVLTFEVVIGNGSGIINICYPYALAQTLLSRIQGTAGDFDNARVQSAADAREHMFDALMSVPVSVTATLGNATIRTEQLLALEVGDVIVTNNTITDSARINVEGVPLFEGRPGQRNRHLVVRALKMLPLSTDCITTV